MTRERGESCIGIPGSVRDAEIFAWKPTAQVEAAADHPRAPPVRDRGGEGTTRSSLGCPPASRGTQARRPYALGGSLFSPTD